MDSQSKMQLIQLLLYILIPILIAILILSGFLIYVYLKDKKTKEAKEQQDTDRKTNYKTGTTSTNKQSIFNFMEFDTVEDSMIIQNGGNRYLMVINCQGVNYDLMSAVEKNSVEEGFVQFLNTLRYPIQIYVQTRSINLENSLQVYRSKLHEVQDKYDTMSKRYELMKDSGQYTREQLAKEYFELTKQANLCEYGNSVVQDTEK